MFQCDDASTKGYYGTFLLSNSDASFSPVWPASAAISSVTIKPDNSAEKWDIANTHGTLLPIVIVAGVLVVVSFIASCYWRRWRRKKVRQMMGINRRSNQQQFAHGRYAGGQHPQQGQYPQFPPQNQYSPQQVRY
jgi:hypothetical protein